MEYSQDDDVLARGYDRRRCPRGLPLPRTSSPSRATPPNERRRTPNERRRTWELSPAAAPAAPRPPARPTATRKLTDQEDSGTDRLTMSGVLHDIREGHAGTLRIGCRTGGLLRPSTPPPSSRAVGCGGGAARPPSPPVRTRRRP